MKLLFDQNLSFKLPARLNDLAPGSTQVRLIGLDGASDLEIWRRAAAEGYTIVSLDADFAELAAFRGPPPRVVWLRCGNQRTAFIEERLRRAGPDLRDFHDTAGSVCLEVY